MSIAKGLIKAVARSPNGSRTTGLTLDRRDGWFGPEDIGDSRDAAMKISTVNRCVEILSSSMAVLPVRITRERDHERLQDHHLGPLLWSRPNDAMSAYTMYRLLMTHELTRGNAYTWLRRHQGTGRVTERIVLDPDCTVPMVMPNGQLWYIYHEPRSGDLIWLPQEDVTHYKAFSTDGLEGISVLRRASLTLSTAQAAQHYERSTWLNGGRPSGVLTTNTDLGGDVTITKDDGTKETITKRERIRREWERVHRGPDNAFRLAVLDNGLEYTPISMTAADAQFVETSELRVLDMCRFFAVPPHLCYAGKQSYESNEQNGIDFVNYTLLPYETEWSQEDSYKMLSLTDRKDSLRIGREMKVFLRGNTEAQANWIRTMREVGAYDVDEIRALDDRGPVPGGKYRLGSLNYIPLERFDELSRRRAEGRKEEE